MRRATHRILLFLAITGLLLCTAAFSSDPYCPAYPVSLRQVDKESRQQERLFHQFSTLKHRPLVRDVAAANFIDDHIFGKMLADGIEPAPLTTDSEFLRRVSMDLTGRIPAPEAVEAFVRDANPDKRAAMVDALVGSEAFVDQWTFFFANQFEVGSTYYNFIGIPGRNLFYRYLREFVALDRPYRDVMAELVAAAGNSHKFGPPNFLIRGFQQGDPIQDTWDTLTDRVTLKFLGVKTECVSCHNGAGHLEAINLYLSRRTREEFWRQSAFFSRLNLWLTPVDVFSQQFRGFIWDRLTGGYHGSVDPNNPGPRPAREGGPFEPAYMFTGERTRNGEWRKELARMLGSDRQFARATVNYIWSRFFTIGIVDPPDGWDLARIDPRNPPPPPWTLQPSHPELLEALADEFIRSNYSIRRIIGLIAKSNAYQLSSRYPGTWKPEYERYFAKHIPRRMTAEEIYDAVSIATMTETPMVIEGFDQPLYYANQLPDPSEPRYDYNVFDFLFNFGRGDWFLLQRNPKTSVIQLLYLMNDGRVNFRLLGNRSGSGSTRVAVLAQSLQNDDEVVRQLFLSTLSRYPSQEELATAMTRKRDDRELWLSDLQWALLNKLDFIFNY
ncbi:MAG TPA: DUF1553 domain-containing protein [Acidobacteriota bacterium]|jgi:hypothetical protein